LAEASSIAGLYVADGEHMEEGRVNLHNNPKVAYSTAQRMLPTTDPIRLLILSNC